MNPYNFQLKNSWDQIRISASLSQKQQRKSFDKIKVPFNNLIIWEFNNNNNNNLINNMGFNNNMGIPSQAQQPLTVTTWQLKKYKNTLKKSPYLGRKEKSVSHLLQLHGPEANVRWLK